MRSSISLFNWIQSSVLWPWSQWNWQYLCLSQWLRALMDGASKGTTSHQSPSKFFTEGEEEGWNHSTHRWSSWSSSLIDGMSWASWTRLLQVLPRSSSSLAFFWSPIRQELLHSHGCTFKHGPKARNKTLLQNTSTVVIQNHYDSLR